MPDQPGTGLRVDLELKDRHLFVSTDGENLGTYPLSQTLVERVTGDRFRLTIGNEILEFSADDALGFSYEAMPAMSGTQTHRPGSWREFWRRNRPSATQRMIPTARPVAMDPVVDSEPERDLVDGTSPVSAEPDPGVAFADLTLDHKVNGDGEPLAALVDRQVDPNSGVAGPDVAAETAEGFPLEGDTSAYLGLPDLDQPDLGQPDLGQSDLGQPESIHQGVALDEVDQGEVTDHQPELTEVPEASLETDVLGQSMVGEAEVEREIDAGAAVDTGVEAGAHLTKAPPPAAPARSGPMPTAFSPPSSEPHDEPMDECRGRRADGSPCGSVAINASGFCFAHDPDLAGERRLMTERVNQTARRARATDPDLEALVVRLERAVADVQDGTLDPQQALAMASLVQAMCDTIGVNRRRET